MSEWHIEQVIANTISDAARGRSRGTYWTHRERFSRCRILIAQRYDYALQTLNDNPYDKWREYDPEDTLRFYALRMREAGFIKSSPQKIVADGADWQPSDLVNFATLKKGTGSMALCERSGGA